MPSDLSTWLVSVPNDGDAEGLLQEISGKLSQSKALSPSNISELSVPSLKTGTLELLVSLSEELPKHDTAFTSITAKLVDTLRNLLNNNPQRLAEHVLVDERSVDDYLLKGWRWNSGKYGVQRGLRDLVDTLVKACEITSIDNVTKNRLNNYNLAKGSLTQLQRKTAGNLSTRSLIGIVTKEQIVESEYLESVFVAVPKNNVNDWNSKYERLAPMVVPRSSQKISQDDDFSLFSVTIFKKSKDQFSQKCRENRFVVRDFVYEENLVEKHNSELRAAEQAEKELWLEMLRVSRTNFSEAYQVLVHLKVICLFVESVLRFGLPANYTGLIIKATEFNHRSSLQPDPKSTKKILNTLTSHFAYLRRKGGIDKKTSGKAEDLNTGEYQALMEQEYFDFVLFEVPWVIT
ncbi:ATPase V1 complex subunit C [Cantharellus anzutake]|uniref:ATPase V1 complex subunit C n=1 Tax=Cantharellus anzutake TaxID=1750568 RepID=UPI0019044A47|nr:ATPase V1 complex subunit C [Cantharellus anzutake]KAF8343051.1 ATPase V1 complex subunit C [Cantharellus anzutake]